MKSFVLALAFVLAASSDWQHIARDDAGTITERLCAKSQATCEAAIAAIRRGWFAMDLAGADLRCEPQAGCFSPASLCIAGHNCPASRR